MQAVLLNPSLLDPLAMIRPLETFQVTVAQPPAERLPDGLVVKFDSS
jgi:hypothetical protein